MKEELRIDIVGLAGACSYALDCIEAELVKIKNKHGKRVAYISVCMAEYLAIQGDALQDLAMCALLHDNALTQYITEELERNYVIDIKKDLSVRKTNLHCIYGEKNITKLPFKTDVSNVILYHHEHADGTGPFQKKWNETPLPARIIHLADTVDIIGNSIKSDDNRWDFICQYLSQKKDSLFDSECVNAFLHVFTKESFMCLSDDSFETKLWEIIPREKMVFDWEMCKNVADFFAKIVDYKSSFTSRHSIGVAEKASLLAKYMGYDSITVQKMYLAGALHDIGKMAVGNEILEKPDKLTDDEFSTMKNHAGYTYLILSEVNDFEEIRDWAAFHHEKLNGKVKSERFIKAYYPDLPTQAFVHYGNFIGETLKIAAEEQVPHVTLGVMMGKAVKLAEGNLDTHSKKVTMNKEFIQDLARQTGCSEETLAAIGQMNLARELWDIIPEELLEKFGKALIELCHRHCAPLLPNGELTILLITENGKIYS